MAPHRDELEAAQQRIHALEDRVEELHPAPIFQIRSQDQMTYSPGIRLSRGLWAGIAVAALVVNLVFVVAAR